MPQPSRPSDPATPDARQAPSSYALAIAEAILPLVCASPATCEGVIPGSGGHNGMGYCAHERDGAARLIDLALAPLEKAMEAASNALRSYQYGNAAPELAGEVADTVDAALGKARA